MDNIRAFPRAPQAASRLCFGLRGGAGLIDEFSWIDLRRRSPCQWFAKEEPAVFPRIQLFP